VDDSLLDESIEEMLPKQKRKFPLKNEKIDEQIKTFIIYQ
jgi:hypothetical protein